MSTFPLLALSNGHILTSYIIIQDVDAALKMGSFELQNMMQQIGHCYACKPLRRFAFAEGAKGRSLGSSERALALLPFALQL